MAWSATNGVFPWARFVNSTVLLLLICASCLLPQTSMAGQQQGKAPALPSEIEQRVSAVCSKADTYDCYTKGNRSPCIPHSRTGKRPRDGA